MRLPQHANDTVATRPDVGPPAVVIHPGSQSSLELSAGLARYGLLRWHLTGIYKGKGWAGRVLGPWVQRHHPLIPPRCVRVRSRDELVATCIARASRDADRARAVHLWRNRRFGRWAGRFVAGRGGPNGVRVVHAYESAALDAFRTAKRAGLTCVLHVVSPTGRFQRGMRIHEVGRHPELADSLPDGAGLPERDALLAAEMRLADRIVVASRFMGRLLVDEGVDTAKIRVIPRAVDLTGFAVPEAEAARRLAPVFRVVYVGNLTEQKGIGYLLDAWRELELPRAELLLVGTIAGRGRWLDAHRRLGVRHVPRVPRRELPGWLARCHVFVFPTLGDGFGAVAPEAMAAGLPIIATPNCCAPDLIEESVEGFIVPGGDSRALAERIERLYRDPELRVAMGRAARVAADRLDPDRYYRRVAGLTCELAGLPVPERTVADTPTIKERAA